MVKKTARRLLAAVGCVSPCALVAIAAMLVTEPAQAQGPGCASSDEPRVIVVIEGLRSDRGEVVVELYPDDPKRFLATHGRLERVRYKAARGGVTACINAPTSGRYALVLYHDENNDEAFNRSKLGLPTEGFGFSNNARPILGPPPLKSVLFMVPEGESTIHVKMRYLITDRG